MISDDEVMALAQECDLGRILAPICDPNPPVFVTSQGYRTDALLLFAERLIAMVRAEKREPLKHMQIVMLWGHRSDGPSTAELVSFARAVERAHGIGGEA